MGIRIILAAFFVTLLAPLLAIADGVHTPLVGYPKLPEIPRQCALITYKDGVETLVVESSYQTDSPAVQWILPVPANPDKIEVADKDMLTSVTMSLRPHVIHDLYGLIKAATLGLLATCIIGYIIVRTPKDGSWIINALTTAFILFALSSCLLPALGTAGDAVLNDPTVNVLSSSHVGNYQVNVLSAQSPETLETYLKDNGFSALPASSKNVVADYIKNKWVFLTAKLDADAKGFHTPHPLSVQFKTTSPVFPMRLTALADTTTRVDLFVVADQQASAKGFETQLADHFNPSTERYLDVKNYKAANINLILGNPDAQKFLWPGCVITHLQANLSPTMMTQDVALSFSPLSTSQKTFYSKQGRNQATQFTLILALIATLLVFVFACRKQQKPTRLYWRIMAITALIGLAAVPFVRYAHPVIPVNTPKHYFAYSWKSQFEWQFHETEKLKTIDDYRAYFQDWIKSENLLNPITDQPLKESKLPGNYQFRQDGEDIDLYYYTNNGTEVLAASTNGQKIRH